MVLMTAQAGARDAITDDSGNVSRLQSAALRVVEPTTIQLRLGRQWGTIARKDKAFRATDGQSRHGDDHHLLLGEGR